MSDHWIQSAVSKHPGRLTAKAKAAGESNSEWEHQHEHDSGVDGKEARLAETLKGLHGVRRK